jgi:hypothetical protein
MRQRYEKQEALLAKQVDSGDGLYHMMASATLTRGIHDTFSFNVIDNGGGYGRSRTCCNRIDSERSSCSDRDAEVSRMCVS